MEYEKMLKRAKAVTPAPHLGERFEMPVPQIHQTKKQTFIKNFSEIAKKLRREDIHIAKFLFRELAVPGNMSGNELILQGRISPSMIAKRIEGYATEFVICEECGKPDTVMTKEGKILKIKCEACGAARSHSA